jgi:hypothetical protein
MGGLQTFGSLLNFELDLLVLFQGAKAIALDC